MTSLALIVGAGPGLSAALARRFAARGARPLLVARDTSDLHRLAAETGAALFDCDASKPSAMASLFNAIDDMDGPLDVAIYNPSAGPRGSIAELDPQEVAAALGVTAYGAFLMAHHASRRMLERGSGTLLFTGASASVKGYPRSAPFAMGKFALRGLCQSLARELHPKGIHVGHVIIDGSIGTTSDEEPTEAPNGANGSIDPDRVAEIYAWVVDQDRSAWSAEVEVRLWNEPF